MTETANVPALQQQLQHPYARHLELISAAARAEIASVADVEKGADLDRMIGQALKKLEEQKKIIQDSLNAARNANIDHFKALTEPLLQARQMVQNKMKDFRARERAEAERLAEEQRKAQETAALEDAAVLEAEGRAAEADEVLEEVIEQPQAAPSLATPKTVRGDLGATTSFRMKPEFKVTDPAAVPREYCEPVDKLIRAAVNAAHGAGKETFKALSIPGVEIWEEEAITTR